MKIHNGYRVQYVWVSSVFVVNVFNFSDAFMYVFPYMFAGTFAHIFVSGSVISFVSVRIQSLYLLTTLLSLTSVRACCGRWVGGWKSELPHISVPGSYFRARIFECRFSDLCCTYIHTCLLLLTWTNSYNNN